VVGALNLTVKNKCGLCVVATKEELTIILIVLFPFTITRWNEHTKHVGHVKAVSDAEELERLEAQIKANNPTLKEIDCLKYARSAKKPITMTRAICITFLSS
jgi:hypothetical protein